MLPSVDEAFGVAYIEAMAGGVPAIGSRGEPGPEEIAASGGGMRLVAPGDPEALAAELRTLLERRDVAPRARRRRARQRRGELHLGGLRPRDRRRLRGRAAMKPVLFVTNHAPPFRVGAFKALHERENVVFALIGGDVRHGGGGTGTSELPFPAIFPSQRAIARLAASGRYRAVIAGLSGRVALPAAYAGARAGRVPFVLWATIWRHPRTPAHALSYLPLRHIYRHADAIATYGPHVSAYVRGKHPKGEVFEAPQSVDADFWSAPAAARAPRRLPDPLRGPARRGEGRRRARPGCGAAKERSSSPAKARCTRRAQSSSANVKRSISATSTRAATLWSYRRFPRATFSSRGGWSSTKPSTREYP